MEGILRFETIKQYCAFNKQEALHPQHFSRMFKKETGLAPSEYRNLN